MKVFVEYIADWEHISSLPTNGEMRHYYLAHAPYRALLVCRGTRLGDLVGRTVDAQVGWDRGDVGFARVPGERQTKVTIFRVTQGHAVRLLGAILRKAPRDDTEE